VLLLWLATLIRLCIYFFRPQRCKWRSFMWKTFHLQGIRRDIKSGWKLKPLSFLQTVVSHKDLQQGPHWKCIFLLSSSHRRLFYDSRWKRGRSGESAFSALSNSHSLISSFPPTHHQASAAPLEKSSFFTVAAFLKKNLTKSCEQRISLFEKKTSKDFWAARPILNLC